MKNGAFEWRLPDVREARNTLFNLLDMKKGENKESEDKDGRNVARALADVASIGVRTGLLHPVFDPASLEEMPYPRSVTVVADTSGVLQGALDFVVRHLPIARIKIPAIVQMEFVNFTHRFFSLRRKDKNQRRFHELIEHLKSQGDSGPFSGWSFRRIPKSNERTCSAIRYAVHSSPSMMPSCRISTSAPLSRRMSIG